MSDTKSLIDAISTGKSTDIEATFSEVFATKVSTAIDAFRSEVASNLFAKPEQQQETQEA